MNYRDFVASRFKSAESTHKDPRAAIDAAMAAKEL